MKTLRDDLWDAYEELCRLMPSEELLAELTQYLGDGQMRQFIDEAIRVWDLEDYFREYEEFAEEEY